MYSVTGGRAFYKPLKLVKNVSSRLNGVKTKVFKLFHLAVHRVTWSINQVFFFLVKYRLVMTDVARLSCALDLYTHAVPGAVTHLPSARGRIRGGNPAHYPCEIYYNKPTLRLTFTLIVCLRHLVFQSKDAQPGPIEITLHLFYFSFPT